MAATVKIMRLSGSIGGGASPDYTDKTSASIRASTSDVPSPGTSNPIPIPSSGCNHSFWVTTVLYTACPADNSLTNLFWYTDGTNSFGTGVECLVNNASSYVQATGAAGSSGSLLGTATHAGVQTAASDAFTYTSNAASKLSISGSLDNTTGASAGDEFVVWQLNVGSTAGAGNVTEETWTFAYDEA